MKNQFFESENRYDDIDDTENENKMIPSKASESVTIKKESFLKKIFKGVSTGSLIVGSGFLLSSFAILQFLFVALTGLSMIALAILLFSKGSIIWGLIALFIGTPIAFVLASWIYSSIFFWALLILASIIWGIINIFGFDVSFDSVLDGIWLVIAILGMGIMAFGVIASFRVAVEDKNVASFFKKSWFFILGFLFFFGSAFLW